MNVQKLLPAKLGADPKKAAVLGVLLLVLLIVFWVNRGPSGGPEASTPATSTVPTTAAVRTPPPVVRPATKSGGSSGSGSGSSSSGSRGSQIAEFKPSLKLSDDMDISRIDPALRLDLLAKVRNVAAEGGNRSLFEFSQPPAPPPPKVNPIVPKAPVTVAAASAVPKGPPEPPKPPPPPPIALKFYGYAGTTRSGTRRAFFLDGDDILVAGENETVKNRYKIVRIGVNSAVVEDTTNKNQQTLPLIEEL
jgi:hypothetical protein